MGASLRVAQERSSKPDAESGRDCRSHGDSGRIQPIRHHGPFERVLDEHRGRVPRFTSPGPGRACVDVTRAWLYGFPDQTGPSGLPTFQIWMRSRKIVTWWRGCRGRAQ